MQTDDIDLFGAPVAADEEKCVKLGIALPPKLLDFVKQKVAKKYITVSRYFRVLAEMDRDGNIFQ